MQYKMYSVRDSKTEIFNLPYMKNTHGEAERDFRSVVNDEKTKLNAYPEDFDLYYIGEYDDCTGKVTCLDTPLHIVKAVQVLAPRQ